MASRCDRKSRSSSLVRGRSQLARARTSLIVTGSITVLWVVASIIFCFLFVFIGLCTYTSISGIKSQYLFDTPVTLMV